MENEAPIDPAPTPPPEPGSEPDAAPAARSIEEELEALRAEREELHEKHLRLAADLDNFRKRARREAVDAERRGKEEALRAVLPVIDNLERAVSAAATAQDVASVVDGVQMVLRSFEDVCSSLQVERVKTTGQRFDPSIHDAIQQLETDAHAPGTVVAELVPGYRAGERLLRAAMVVVAKPEASPAPADTKSEPESE